MKIKVGSLNPAKVEAVREILQDYPHLAAAEVEGVEAASGVADQPMGIEETFEGAMNRAKAAFKDCDYAIGLESGLIRTPSRTGYMDVCVCAIYDGTICHFGTSGAWEFPDPKVLDLILNEGMEMKKAMVRSGASKNERIGQEEGAIGVFTKGRLDRKGFTKQALVMALIHLEEEWHD